MKILILHPVLHDGKRLAEGESVSIDDTQAQALIACGAAEAVVRAKGPTKAELDAKAKADADAAAAAEAEAKALADAAAVAAESGVQTSASS